jgi:hypothetical protein
MLRRNSPLLSSAALLSVLAGSAVASLCVWRQPDADISSIFGSGSYKTVFVDISDAQQQSI